MKMIGRRNGRYVRFDRIDKGLRRYRRFDAYVTLFCIGKKRIYSRVDKDLVNLFGPQLRWKEARRLLKQAGFDLRTLRALP